MDHQLRMFVPVVQVFEQHHGAFSLPEEGGSFVLDDGVPAAAGQGKEGDLELLLKMSQLIKDTSLCGLGQTAPNPVLSTIRYFRDEYVEHIRDKKCRAAVCNGTSRPARRSAGIDSATLSRSPCRPSSLTTTPTITSS